MTHGEISIKASSRLPVDQKCSRFKNGTMVIDKRFCGPPGSGNGGYVCGRLSQFIDAPAVTVRLLLPVPLDTELKGSRNRRRCRSSRR